MDSVLGVIRLETFAIFVSILLKRQRHLTLKMPVDALSATTRGELILRLKPFFIPVSAGPCG